MSEKKRRPATFFPVKKERRELKVPPLESRPHLDQ
jgi:hypothetical protein